MESNPKKEDIQVKNRIEKKRKQMITGLFFSAILLLAAGLFLLFQQKEKNQGKYAAVCVTTPFLSGQGVVYEQQGEAFIIVTAGHLVREASPQEELLVSFEDGSEEKAQLLYLSDSADVAFLSVHNTGNGKLVAAKKDRSRFDAVIEGDVVEAYHLENGRFTRIRGSMLSPWIYLEDFALDMSVVQIEGEAGMSGCGIYDKNGYFLGILCGVSENEAAVLPFSVIESEWMMAQTASAAAFYGSGLCP